MIKNVLAFFQPALIDGEDVHIFYYLVNSTLTGLLLLVG